MTNDELLAEGVRRAKRRLEKMPDGNNIRFQLIPLEHFTRDEIIKMLAYQMKQLDAERESNMRTNRFLLGVTQ